ncbi:MAG: antibiotic biosynthesis monooxygenase [Desulfovibrio sp.]|nr:antibiotic biosynthesis monooxygenase [Desulfovibrio sp.]MBI4959030.1 antibiotic biosynthesis monooxygenase [Desulfovibrio sp.]
MIAREWRCHCPIRHRIGFLEHLDATGVSECRSLPGFLGYQILERDLGPELEITLVTYWRSVEDIVAFAGQDITRARLYPDDAHFEITPDQEVRHYSVLAQETPES